MTHALLATGTCSIDVGRLFRGNSWDVLLPSVEAAARVAAAALNVKR